MQHTFCIQNRYKDQRRQSYAKKRGHSEERMGLFLDGLE